MPRKPLTVFILCKEYMVIDSPDPLVGDRGERLDATVDHEERVIWINPRLPSQRRTSVVAQAVSEAWRQAWKLAPLAG